MKKKILMALAALGVSCAAMAQDGLAVGDIFGGKLKGQTKPREVYVKGRSLEPYGLSMFKSLMATGDTLMVKHMERAAQKDAEAATDVKRIVDGGEPIAIYLQLAPRGESKVRRFVLYRRRSAGDAALIYAEGETSLKEIIKIQRQ